MLNVEEIGTRLIVQQLLARFMYIYMGSCQNDGPFLGTLNIRSRIIIGIQKGTIILTTTHIYVYIIFSGHSLLKTNS